MAWNEPGPGRDPWNSPSGGNRGGDKPPDFGAAMKKLRAWLGGSGSGGVGKTPPPGTIGLIATVVVAGWLMSGFYAVDEQERGIVLRFGHYAGTTDPGVKWHMPWPVEHVEKVNVTRARSATSRATLLTRDEDMVEVELTVQYRVGSPEEFLFNVTDPDTTLQQAASSSLREVVGASSMEEVLTGGRQTVADKAKRRLQGRLDAYKAGLTVTEVILQQVQAPEAVKAAFDDAVRAREDRQRVENDAQAYSDDRLPHARADAARQLAEAAAYRDQTVARAEGDAARFTALLEQYRRAPEVTRDRLYIDAMSDVLNQSGKVLVDIGNGNPTIYIPLDRLTRNGDSLVKPPSVPDDAVVAAPSAPRAPSTPGSTAPRSDSNRSRDRESH